MRHGDLNINAWTAIFFLAGILSNAWKPFTVFLAISILDVSKDPHAVCASVVYFVIGFAFAQALRQIFADKK
jgi:hypothetical protein